MGIYRRLLQAQLYHILLLQPLLVLLVALFEARDGFEEQVELGHEDLVDVVFDVTYPNSPKSWLLLHLTLLHGPGEAGLQDYDGDNVGVAAELPCRYCWYTDSLDHL